MQVSGYQHDLHCDETCYYNVRILCLPQAGPPLSMQCFVDMGRGDMRSLSSEANHSDSDCVQAHAIAQVIYAYVLPKRNVRFALNPQRVSSG